MHSNGCEVNAFAIPVIMFCFYAQSSPNKLYKRLIKLSNMLFTVGLAKKNLVDNFYFVFFRSEDFVVVLSWTLETIDLVREFSLLYLCCFVVKMQVTHY